MATTPTTSGQDTYSCPFGCGSDVPKDANFCPGCAQQVIEFCPNPICRRRIRRPRGRAACPGCGNMPEAVGGVPLPPRQVPCPLCGENMPHGVSRCPNCGRRTAGFKRLCPHCKKEVELTADLCKRCGVHFPTVVSGKFRYSFVNCLACPRPPEEVDDWMAARNLPFLFQTERGVKVGCFPNQEEAARVCRYYFGLDDLETVHSGKDEAPWTFISHEHALEFMHNLSCVCGAKAWEFTPWRGAARKLTPEAAEAAKKGLTWFGGHLKGAFNHLAKKGGK